MYLVKINTITGLALTFNSTKVTPSIRTLLSESQDESIAKLNIIMIIFFMTVSCGRGDSSRTIKSASS